MDVQVTLDIMVLTGIQGELMFLKDDLSKKLKMGIYADHVEDGYRDRIKNIDIALETMKSTRKQG